MNFLITIDTEVWCGGWTNLDARFPGAFQQHIYGHTPSGEYGLRYQLKVLSEHGLKAVFFVEPLFALRFGMEPLKEIVGLVQEAGQAVELHLHTEWVDEARDPLFPGVLGKRQHIKQFSRPEQHALLLKGIELLQAAGVKRLHAYRAGSFGANDDTLEALGGTSIGIDSSFNATAEPCSIGANMSLCQPTELTEGVLEVPMTIFVDGLRKPRPLQITACSFAEMRTVMGAAERAGWKHIVLLSHSFELLDATRRRKNPVVVRRFLQLCEYLARNADRFKSIDFSDPSLVAFDGCPELPHVPFSATARRVAEQAWSRVA